MAITQRTVTLNDFGLERRERTSSTGTAARYTVSIQAAPLVHTFDPRLLGAGPATAIAEHLRGRIKGLQVEASPVTVKRRKSSLRAFETGDMWAHLRYDGGKMGPMPPAQSTKMFNDSGRLAAGLIAQVTRDNSWIVNVPANRFDPSTFYDGGEAGIMRMFARLRELIPEFGDANQLRAIASVRESIAASLDLILAPTGSMGGQMVSLQARRQAAQLEALRAALDVAMLAAG